MHGIFASWVESWFLDNLRKEGAEVVVGGKGYYKAYTKAQEAAAKDDEGYGDDASTEW